MFFLVDKLTLNHELYIDTSTALPCLHGYLCV